jgi:hypothetical protein
LGRCFFFELSPNFSKHRDINDVDNEEENRGNQDHGGACIHLGGRRWLPTLMLGDLVHTVGVLFGGGSLQPHPTYQRHRKAI